MAVSVSEFTSFVSTPNASNYTCMANVTPPTNKLLLCWVRHGLSTGVAGSPTVTGCGLTWNFVSTQSFRANTARLSLYTARGTPSTGTIHIALGATQANCFVTIDQCTGESGTLVQSVTSQGDGLSTITCVLSAFSGSGNGMAVAFSNTSSTAALNPRDSSNANFTPKLSEVRGTGTATDSGALASAWTDASWFTSGATWGTSGSAAAIACEINVAAAGGAVISPYYSAYYSHIVTGVS